LVENIPTNIADSKAWTRIVRRAEAKKVSLCKLLGGKTLCGADYTAIMSHLENRNLPYFTYHPKSLRPVKAVIQHLPRDTSAENISGEVVALGNFCGF